MMKFQERDTEVSNDRGVQRPFGGLKLPIWAFSRVRNFSVDLFGRKILVGLFRLDNKYPYLRILNFMSNNFISFSYKPLNYRQTTNRLPVFRPVRF